MTERLTPLLKSTLGQMVRVPRSCIDVPEKLEVGSQQEASRVSRPLIQSCCVFCLRFGTPTEVRPPDVKAPSSEPADLPSIAQFPFHAPG